MRLPKMVAEPRIFGDAHPIGTIARHRRAAAASRPQTLLRRQLLNRRASSHCQPATAIPVAQPPEALAALRAAVAAKDDLELTALSAAVAAAGSLVIALALGAGRINAAAAFEAAQLDESYQIARWGEDPEATRRRAAIHAELDAAARLMALLRD